MPLFSEINAVGFADLQAQVNLAFKNIFELPNIRGTQGDAGDTIIGGAGLRGANTTVLNLDDINTNFGTTFSEVTLTITACNSLLDTDFSLFESATLFGSLINSDLVILPNGQLTSFDLGLNDLVDTGIDLTGDELFATIIEVNNIVDAAIAAALAAATGTGLSTFEWVGKIVEDLAGDTTVNQTIQAGSVLDIGRDDTDQAFTNTTVNYESYETDGKTLFVGPEDLTTFLANIQANLTTPELAKEIVYSKMPWLTVLSAATGGNNHKGIALGNTTTLGYGLFAHISKNASQELEMANTIEGAAMLIIKDGEATLPMIGFVAQQTAEAGLLDRIAGFDAAGDMEIWKTSTDVGGGTNDTLATEDYVDAEVTILENADIQLAADIVTAEGAANTYTDTAETNANAYTDTAVLDQTGWRHTKIVNFEILGVSADMDFATGVAPIGGSRYAIAFEINLTAVRTNTTTDSGSSVVIHGTATVDDVGAYAIIVDSNVKTALFGTNAISGVATVTHEITNVIRVAVTTAIGHDIVVTGVCKTITAQGDSV